MKTNRFMTPAVYRRRTAAGWAGLVACTVVAWRTNAQSQYDPDWARHFRIGALGGFNIKASLRPITSPLPISGGKPGVYDDGYVIPDPANHATGPLADMTTDWGYNDASQFDPGTQTLTMHQSTSFTPTTGTTGREDSGPRGGFELEYGGNLWYWKNLRFGWELGFGFLPIDVKDSQPMTGQVDRSLFTFDVGSSVPFFPPPGYHGHAGDGGTGIHSTPNPGGPDTPIAGVTLSGSRELDVTLYTFRAGPSIFWDLNDYIGLSLGAGPTVGLVSGEYRFHETLNIGGNSTVNKGSFGSTELLFGGYVNGTITYHAVKNGDFYLSAQFMPLGSTSFSKGGRSAKLDLSGALFISAGVNWPF